MVCVVIFNDNHGWHSDQLEAALTGYEIKVVRSSLAQCRIDLDLPSGLYIPGLGTELPNAVITRGIAAGSFEQISLRLDILHALTELGIPVFNSAPAIERTVDKARTSLLLHYKGVPTPRVWACEDADQIRLLSARAQKEKYELVLKPLFGCQGQGITRLSSIADLDTCEVTGGLYYLQEFIPPIQTDVWQDWRVFVVNHRCIAAMVRRGRTWVTNAAQGAECFPAALDPEISTLACQATRAVAVDYAGVDLIQSLSRGFQVLEVNSAPSWKALQQTTEINIAEALVEFLLERLQHPC
jgi:RimK family alpha-L-glutamate ligase